MHIQKYRRNEFVPLMIELIRLYHPHTYVEIGVADGYTLNKLVASCLEVKKFVGVDILPLPHMQKLSEGYEDRIQIFEKTSSQDFAKTWNEPIDMLFIDGDHNKETVEHDFFQIGKFVRRGTGLILMHDTHPVTEALLAPGFCNNAWEFADKLFVAASTQHEAGSILNGYLEVLTLPGPWAGMTIVRKRGNHHLAWKT